MSNEIESGARFDPTSQAMRLDPVGTLSQVREQAPVQWCDELGFWVVARYDHCWELARDPRLSFAGGGFGANIPMEQAAELAGDAGDELMRAAEILSSSFSFMDPPEHTRIRSLVSTAFSARSIESQRDDIQRLADDLLDGVPSPGEFDLVADFADPFPLSVISHIIGIPAEQRPTFHVWWDRLEALMRPNPTTATFSAGLEAMVALIDYIEDLVARRRDHPSEDLLSQLVQAEVGQDRLSRTEVVSTVLTIFAAGSITTQRLIANGVIALVRNPDQLARLRADHTIAPTAIEELLRFHNPDFRTDVPRIADVDVVVGDQRIPAGQSIRLLFGAANRDPERFDDPDTLDLTRPNNRHLTFGRGEHFCLGAPLTRLEGEVAITSLLDRFESIELLDEFQRTSTALYDAGFPTVPVAVS